MLGKLLKYDFKSMFRVFVPLWLALLAVSVVNHFTTRMAGRYGGFLGAMPTTVFMIAYVGLVVAVMVMTIVLIILRFYHGLLKDEGYLMFTLPVRPWQLITSKCIAATVISVLSLLFGILSVICIAADVGEMGKFFAVLWKAMPQVTGQMVLTLVLTVLLILAAVLAEITHVYAALALGHLANSHRIAFAVLAYIVINVVLSILMILFANAADYFQWEFAFLQGNSLEKVNLVLEILTLLCAAQVAVFFVITERILSKRLNLE